MEVLIKFKLTVDGKCPNVADVFFEKLVEKGFRGITSEEVDGTKDYFIGIEQITLEGVEDE